MPSLVTCRAEIERLHDRFVAWYGGTADTADFAAIAGALADEFEMVTPDGERVPRDRVLAGIRERYDTEPPDDVAIDIKSVELVATVDEHATVRYEEWQTIGGESTGRISTVLLRTAPDAPGGLTWLDLHETWLA